MIKYFYFFTATVLTWKHLLKNDKYKNVIVDSFRYLVENKLVRIFAFVIMPNHFHTVWKINEEMDKPDFQRNLQKYTSQISYAIYNQIIKNYMENCCWSKDRKYQLWERNPLAIPLYSQKWSSKK